MQYCYTPYFMLNIDLQHFHINYKMIILPKIQFNNFEFLPKSKIITQNSNLKLKEIFVILKTYLKYLNIHNIHKIFRVLWVQELE